MSRRILLADDSVTIQKVIELTFMDDDYEVRAVGNGDEALAMLTALTVDFVIADVHMPGASGYEVCRRSKQLRPEVPVLLLVGTFEPFDEAQARECGANSYLKKPFDSQELLGRVHELLEAASTGGAPATAAGGPHPEPGAAAATGPSEGAESPAAAGAAAAAAAPSGP
ncbi:MAG TPA: response regulator, partial [Thermoanaerobaculia bacterium]|nr:response regulator [Thermoanaerobaculia bacterium]